MAELNLVQGLEVLDRRTRTVRTVILAYIALSLADMLAIFAEVAGAVDTNAAELSPLSLAASLVHLLFAIVMIAAIVLVAMWIYRAHANLKEAGLTELEFTPGWAVGWYFIPFANLIKPFQAMRELWNMSLVLNDGFGQEADSRLKTWWGAWIVGNIVSNLGLRLQFMSDGEGATVGYALDIISTAVLIAASWFLLQIIETVNAAQRSGTTMAPTFA
jgi:hypothetical protein